MIKIIKLFVIFVLSSCAVNNNELLDNKSDIENEESNIEQNETNSYEYLTDHFIEAYVRILDLNVKVYYWGDLDVQDYSYTGNESNSIDSIVISPLCTKFLASFEQRHLYEGLSIEKKEEMITLHNDNYFEGSLASVFSYPVSAESLTKLDIITNFDYNTNFPAGSSISYIVSIEYSDLVSYLKNGYRFDAGSPEQEFHYDSNTFNRKEVSLNKFNSQNQELISLERTFLKLDEQPEITGQYSFTIIYTDESGVSLSMESDLIGIIGIN